MDLSRLAGPSVAGQLEHARGDVDEAGMILAKAKSSPDKIIATGTDWRFLREVRKELGI